LDIAKYGEPYVCDIVERYLVEEDYSLDKDQALIEDVLSFEFRYKGDFRATP